MTLPSIFASRTLPWVLLALSVALNAFFIGGHVYTRSLSHRLDGPAEARTSALVKKLELNDQQRTAFRDSRRAVGTKLRELRGDARPHVNKLWDEMTKAEPDEATIDGELKAIGDMRLGFERSALASTRVFMKSLTPDQRREFAEFARERFPGPPGMGGTKPIRQPPERKD